MPLRIPSVTAEDVWEYVTRDLTNLSDTRAGYIDLLVDGTYGLEAIQGLAAAIPTTPELEASALARYNVFKTVEFEKCQAPVSGYPAVSWAVTTTDRSLGLKSIIDIIATAIGYSLK